MYPNSFVSTAYDYSPPRLLLKPYSPSLAGVANVRFGIDPIACRPNNGIQPNRPRKHDKRHQITATFDTNQPFICSTPTNANIDILPSANLIAFDHANSILYTDNALTTIRAYPLNVAEVSDITITPGLSFGTLSQMVFDSSRDTLYFTTTDSSSLWALLISQPAGGINRVAISLAPFNIEKPGPMVIDEQRQIIYMVHGTNKNDIIRVPLAAPSNAASIATNTGSYRIGAINSIAFDPLHGILYLADSSLNCIVRLSTDDFAGGRCLDIPFAPSTSFSSLAINSLDQTLYASHSSTGQFYIIPLRQLTRTRIIEFDTFVPAANGPADHALILQSASSMGAATLFSVDTITRNVYQYSPQSALLATLNISSVDTLSPAFSPGTLLYHADTRSAEITLTGVTATCGANVSVATSQNGIDQPARLTFQQAESTIIIALTWSLTYVYLRVDSPDGLHTVYYTLAIGSIPALPPVQTSLIGPQSFVFNVLSGFHVIPLQSQLFVNSTVTLFHVTPRHAPTVTTVLELTATTGTLTQTKLIFTPAPSLNDAPTPSILVDYTAPSVSTSVEFTFTVSSLDSHPAQYLAPAPISITILQPSFFSSASSPPDFKDSNLIYSLEMPRPATPAITFGDSTPYMTQTRTAGIDILNEGVALTPGIIGRVSVGLTNCVAYSDTTFSVFEFVSGILAFRASPRRVGTVTTVRMVTETGERVYEFDLTQYNIAIEVGQTLGVRSTCNVDSSNVANSGAGFTAPACASYDRNAPCTFTPQTTKNNFRWTYHPTIPAAQMIGRAHSTYGQTALPAAQYKRSHTHTHTHHALFSTVMSFCFSRRL